MTKALVTAILPGFVCYRTAGFCHSQRPAVRRCDKNRKVSLQNQVLLMLSQKKKKKMAGEIMFTLSFQSQGENKAIQLLVLICLKRNEDLCSSQK